MRIICVVQRPRLLLWLCLASWLWLCLATLATVNSAIPNAYAQNPVQSKDAVLLVAFGTSIQAAQPAYTNIEKQVQAAYPDKELRWAWTAHSLLKADPNAPRLSVQEALAKLATEGVRTVYVLSLHVIPGIEYAHLAQTARAFEGLPKGIQKIHLSQPLLHNTDSLSTVAGLLIKNAPARRTPDEALLFVGHGTRHNAGVYYPALQYYLHTLDKNAFVGALEGSPNKATVCAALRANGVRRVWLAPLMTVAGDHTLNDLFGARKDSWKQTLMTNGIQVEAISKGLGEYPALVEQWVQNLKNVVP